ncbi:Fic family protein [Candidatus Micrarchaeota archaeon CG10_big_fil_rev_8_21_14_0_10_45_29]|nr:MAG: Fic family protein [Candidatus Micrarchaeota archaeon CG10_big_fil_rev_8_21_14_0_10_45_29]
MHIEIRRKNNGKKYYLAHSYRRGTKVRKIRVYLGADLSKNELSKAKKEAQKKLKERLSEAQKIHDPLKTVLSKEEINEIEKLELRANIKIEHLSEDEWLRFTELFTYNTNAIEGSSLESKEVNRILEEDKWPDKPKEDISETYGVAKAISYIRKTKEHISLPLILGLHKMVFENSKPFAGKYRPKGLEVVITDGRGGIVHRGAPAAQIKSLLTELVNWYEKNKKRYSPLVLAAVVHNQFENIHPFQDGNGRVGRLLLNNILLKHKMPPLNIELKNRQEYYESLRAYEKEYNLRPSIELILKEYKAMKKMLKKR